VRGRFRNATRIGMCDGRRSRSNSEGPPEIVIPAVRSCLPSLQSVSLFEDPVVTSIIAGSPRNAGAALTHKCAIRHRTTRQPDVAFSCFGRNASWRPVLNGACPACLSVDTITAADVVGKTGQRRRLLPLACTTSPPRAPRDPVRRLSPAPHGRTPSPETSTPCSVHSNDCGPEPRTDTTRLVGTCSSRPGDHLTTISGSPNSMARSCFQLLHAVRQRSGPSRGPSRPDAAL
jgi:hypothetical protein